MLKISSIIGFSTFLTAIFEVASPTKLPKSGQEADPMEINQLLGSNFNGNDETRLTELLMSRYRGLGLARPVYDIGKAMQVEFRLVLDEFTDLDEHRGTVRIVAAISASWHDEFLRWNNSSTFRHIGGIVVRGRDIFTPIILPVGSRGDMAPVFQKSSVSSDHSQSAQTSSGGTNSLFWVESNGLVHATSTESFETTCRLNVANFPFDKQHCPFHFKVLQFRQPRIRLRINSSQQESGGEADANSEENVRIAHPMWQITNVEGAEAEQLDGAFGRSYSAVVYTVSMQRKAGYYMWTILLPTASMAAVQISVFCLPFSAERVMYSITAVLALDIFQSSLQSKIHTSAAPLPLVHYSSCQLVMGIIITIESIIVLGITASPEPLPRWLVRMFEIVGRKGRRGGVLKKVDNNKLSSSFNSQTSSTSTAISSLNGGSLSELAMIDNSDGEEQATGSKKRQPFYSSHIISKKQMKHRQHHAVAIMRPGDDPIPNKPPQEQSSCARAQNGARTPPDAADCAISEKVIERSAPGSGDLMSNYYQRRKCRDIKTERYMLAVFTDRLFLIAIVVFFSILPIAFFKISA